MNGPTLGLVGGVIGGAVGILGGIIGTYISVHNAKTPAVRRLLSHASIWMWLGTAATIVSQFVLPVPWCWFVWLPYTVVLPIAIWHINKRYNTLRQFDL